MKEEFGSNYRDVFYQPGEAPVFCYRSGLTVYEETFSGGLLAASGWNAAGYPLNVLSNCPTRLNTACFSEPQAFRLEADGEPADCFLDFADFSTEECVRGTHAVLTLKSRLMDLSVRVHTWLDGTPVLTRAVELINTGSKPLTVSRFAPMSGGLEILNKYNTLAHGLKPEEFYTLAYMDNANWGKEGNINRHPLMPDKTGFSGFFNRDRHRHPMFILKNRVLGTSLIAQLAWSGGYDFSFDYQATPEEFSTRLSFSMDLASHAPLLLLAPGEHFTSPEVYIGLVAGDEDDAVNAMNGHVRKSVLFETEKVSRQLLVGAGMGAEHDMSVETTKNFMDQMAYIGCELFIVDAGWYTRPHEELNGWAKRAGCWYPDPERYPNGLEEIVDYCHRKGMKFGLWMEAERLAASEIAAQHPDWFARKRDGSRVSELLDLTNEEAAAWAEAEATRVISSYRPELFRVDYNVPPVTLNSFTEKNGVMECNALRHVKAFYRLYRNLKEKFPDVIFENCAGGGGRTDLGQLRQFHHTWVSDNQTAPRSFLITNGMTMALPPERVDRLVAGMGCHSFASLDFQMRQAMFGHLTMNVFSPRAAGINTQQLEFIRHSIELYKTFARPLIADCRIYHHTPSTRDVLESGFGILEEASPAGDRAMLGIFSFAPGSAAELTVRPRGILPSGSYTVTFDNRRCSASVSGFELVNSGLRVRLPSALSSELILIQKE